MPSKVEPTTEGWNLVENTRTSVIYDSPELGLSVVLTKFEGIWTIEYSDFRIIGGRKIGEERLKHVAVARAKAFMHQHPVFPEMISAFMPGEKLRLKAGKFKRPGRVTQFSRHRR